MSDLKRSAKMKKILHVGGVIALGFDPTESFLLVVSHSGRGVYETASWSRVARDSALAYPENNQAIGIGPIAGMTIPITELDYDTEKLKASSPSGQIVLEYSSGTLEFFDQRKV
jgi:hypothetical protein